ncbi:MAG: hypothetical protein FD146_2763 [Anaerolineaceae bacterium]|nr:MAG: hypothetical protein FD146_2763 [Anaerolineaceae bacterium]
MNHRPFEDWLLTHEPLSAQQKRELTAHLHSCRSCSALAEVDLAFRAARQAGPAGGFADRFQVRLEARKQALRRRNIWGFLLLTLAVIGVLLWIGWPALASFFQSPVNTLASWLSYLIALWTSLQAMGQVSRLFFDVLPGFVPPLAWTVILLGAAGWGLLWVVSLMKFSRIPQGV